MQPELCPKLLTFRGDELFKEGHTLAFLEHGSLISCLLSHRQADTCPDGQASLVEIKVCQDSGLTAYSLHFSSYPKRVTEGLLSEALARNHGNRDNVAESGGERL